MTQPDDTPMVSDEVWNRHDSPGQTLLYTLRQEGWRRGEPVMVYDTTVVVGGRDREAVAARVLSALAASPPLAEGTGEAAMERVVLNAVQTCAADQTLGDSSRHLFAKLAERPHAIRALRSALQGN